MSLHCQYYILTVTILEITMWRFDTRTLKFGSHDYSDHDLQDLPYLNQTIEEALRLHPAVPSALPRIVPQEGADFAGNYLPGGSTVSTQPYSLHRNPSVFKNPEKFDPSRWAAPTKDMKDSMMPFGGGSRSKSEVLLTFFIWLASIS